MEKCWEFRRWCDASARPPLRAVVGDHVGRGRRARCTPEPIGAEQVRAALVEVIAAEGPISRARLVRLVAESFGLSRVSGNR